MVAKLRGRPGNCGRRQCPGVIGKRDYGLRLAIDLGRRRGLDGRERNDDTVSRKGEQERPTFLRRRRFAGSDRGGDRAAAIYTLIENGQTRHGRRHGSGPPTSSPASPTIPQADRRPLALELAYRATSTPDQAADEARPSPDGYSCRSSSPRRNVSWVQAELM